MIKFRDSEVDNIITHRTCKKKNKSTFIIQAVAIDWIYRTLSVL